MTTENDTIPPVRYSAMWTEALNQAIRSRAPESYPVEFHGNSEDFAALQDAVNQGIDSHLEAVHFTEFAGGYGRRGFSFAPDSLAVLVRRLMEAEDEAAQSLADTICSTLEIELV